MVCGTVLVSTCLLVLGWTREIVSVFVADETKVSLWDQEGLETHERLVDADSAT